MKDLYSPNKDYPALHEGTKKGEPAGISLNLYTFNYVSLILYLPCRFRVRCIVFLLLIILFGILQNYLSQ